MSPNPFKLLWLKSPRTFGAKIWRVLAYSLLLLFIVIGAAVGYVSRADFQRKLIIEKVTPLVDSLAIEYVHVTPWSASLQGVDVAYQGGKFHVGKLQLRFNPLALLDGTISIHRLYVRYTDLDLQNWRSTPSTKPFAGVFPSLNMGYGVVLNNIDAAVSILLPAQQGITAHLTGGGIHPHVAGKLDYDVAYTPLNSTDHINASGTVELDQLARGRFRAVKLDAAVRAALAGVKIPEHIHLNLGVEPPPGLEGSAYRVRRVQRPDGTMITIPNPEAVSVQAHVGDDAVPNAATISVNGLYRGEDGVATAGYQIAAGNDIVRALGIAAVLPKFQSALNGALQFETMANKGLVTVESATQMTALAQVLGENAALPSQLTLTSRSSGTFDKSTLQLNETSINAADIAPRLSFKLSAPLSVSFAAPLDILQTPRTLASLNIGPIPLNWLNGKLAPRELTGDLAGEFNLLVDDKKRLRVEAAKPMTISALSVKDGAHQLVNDLNLTAKPAASWSNDFVRVAIEGLSISNNGKTLLNTTVRAALKQAQPDPKMWRYRLQGAVDVDPLLALPVLRERVAATAVPGKIGVTFKSLVGQREQALSFEKLEVSGAQSGRTQLLNLKGLQTFHVALDVAQNALTNPVGDLAQVEIHGFDLSWLNAFLSDISLNGQVSSLIGTLRAPNRESFSFQTSQPLKIEGLEMRRAGKPALRGVNIAFTPKITYGDNALNAEISELAINANNANLIRGSTTLAVRALGSPKQTISVQGQLTTDLHGLAQQPIVANAVEREIPNIVIKGDADYALTATAESIQLSRGDVKLKLGEHTDIRLSTESGLTIRTKLAPGDNLAQAVVGQASLEVTHLTSELLAQFSPLPNISFAEINSKLELHSDGQLLQATSLAPLGIRDVQITDGKKPILNLFSLTTNAKLVAEQQELRATLNDISLAFHEHMERAALQGNIDATIVPGQTVPFYKLDAKLSADIPQLLSQPAVMPGHKLTAGELSLHVGIAADRKLEANLMLDKLAANAPLAISTFELPMTGALAADGRGFDFTAPLAGHGKSGVTSATVIAHYAPQPDELRVLHVDVASDVFFLNDILAAAAAIDPRVSTPQSESTTAKQPIALNDVPDKGAAWKVIAPALVVDLKVNKLFYTDYLAFTDVAAHLNVRRHKLAITGVKAHFHDSALAFDSVTRFKDEASDPYDLNTTGSLDNFNLNQFFTELVPGQKPRVEGLFGVKFKAFGKFLNFSQLRNRALFDITMESREGLFRPLPPDSTLLIGASDVLGVVGEGLSYVPTGGFGAGVIARLINYIQVIDYDSIDIHLVRDESKDVRVEQFLVLSPTIALSAQGGITAQAGHDIMDSPLSLTANLDMLGRGAAILYSMDLMQDAQNAQGYWKGPEFKITGTLAEPKSNFAEIIQQASDGTVKGAITRPISGLIGNLKYRWFNDDSNAKEAAQAARRAKKAASSTLPASPLPKDTD